jgi:GNAT superfamily N-acetyltransferase
MSALNLRAANEGDVPRLVEFQAGLARETEDKQLDLEVVERGVRRVLDDPDRGRYVVAELEGEVVGSLMLTREWSDWRDGWWVWIQSVYTAEAARRLGVYRALHAHVVELCKAAPDVLGIRLYVEEANRPARRAYEGLGMAESSYRFYETDLR